MAFTRGFHPRRKTTLRNVTPAFRVIRGGCSTRNWQAVLFSSVDFRRWYSKTRNDGIIDDLFQAHDEKLSETGYFIPHGERVATRNGPLLLRTWCKSRAGEGVASHLMLAGEAR
jgi:hypothetical protein